MKLALILTILGASVMLAPAAGAAIWHGHTVKARFDGQIDASPCPTASCLRGIVGVFFDGTDVRDHVVSCAWPRHPRILDFSRRGYPHRHYVKVRACGRNHWWRFR